MTSSARDGTNASVLTYHRIIEAFKFGYAWRSRLGDPAFNMDKNISEVSERYRGYYMAARRNEIYLRVWKKRKFVSPSDHVMFYLLYKHQ